MDDYKAVYVCLEEFARQQRLQSEKNPEWYLFGMKDARDGDQKLQQIKVNKRKFQSNVNRRLVDTCQQTETHD